MSQISSRFRHRLAVRFVTWRVEVAEVVKSFERSKYGFDKFERAHVVWAGEEAWWRTIHHEGQPLHSTGVEKDEILVIRKHVTDTPTLTMLGTITMTLAKPTRVITLEQIIVLIGLTENKCLVSTIW